VGGNRQNINQIQKFNVERTPFYKDKNVYVHISKTGAHLTNPLKRHKVLATFLTINIYI